MSLIYEGMSFSDMRVAIFFLMEFLFVFFGHIAFKNDVTSCFFPSILQYVASRLKKCILTQKSS